MSFENLVFMDSGWLDMEKGYVSGNYDNFVKSDGTLGILPSAMQVEKSRDVSLKNVSFRSMGTSALEFKSSERVSVVGSYFKDVGGLGIKTNCSGTVKIADNIFHKVGNTYGIGSIYDYGTCFDGRVRVQNNLIFGPHGNSIAVLNDASNANQEHLISNNFFYGSVQRYTDTGAMGGAVGRTKLLENVFNSVTDSKWSDKGHTAAVYWDIGSFYNEAQYNVFKQVDVAFQLNCQGRNIVKNNYVSAVKKNVLVTMGACDIGTFPNIQPQLNEELSRNTPDSLAACSKEGTCISSSVFDEFNNKPQYEWVIAKAGPSSETLNFWKYIFSKANLP